MKPSGFEVVFVGRLLNMNSISLTDKECSDYLLCLG
jgi:hypothetical protein